MPQFQKPDKDLEGKDVTKVNYPADEFSKDDLLRMLVDSNRQNAEAQRQLADAILESRKPYVDPKVVEAKERDAKERKMMIDRELRNRQSRRLGCPHVRDNGTDNIKWMEHSNGITKGVCGTCQAEFDTRNKDDYALLRRNIKAIRNMGRCGSHARKGIGEVLV